MKNELINHICKFMSKRHHILPSRASFFILSARKIVSMQEAKIKFFM